MFPITRVYNDSNGDSKFEETTIPLKDAGEIGNLSMGIPVTSMIFREVKQSYDYYFHKHSAKTIPDPDRWRNRN